jgi:hypothetical protein
MICPTCHGEGSYWNALLGEKRPCPDCIGGIASCCDAAGGLTPVFVCAACGAMQQHRMIKCEQCGEPLVFPKFEDDPYRDDAFLERPCDLCGKLYRGPAVYCSLKCALDDAA